MKRILMLNLFCVVWVFSNGLPTQNRFHSDHRSGLLKLEFVNDGNSLTKKTGSEQAWEYLEHNFKKYGLPESLENLEISRVQESLIGTHYYFQQYLHDIPVHSGEIIVSISKETQQVYMVFNNTFPVDASLAKADEELLVDEDSAYGIAWQDLRVHGELLISPELEKVYVFDGRDFKLVYLVRFGVEAPFGYWEHEIDAINGEVRNVRRTTVSRNPEPWDFTTYEGAIWDRQAACSRYEKKQRAQAALEKNENKASGSAVVFDPDPVTTLQNSSLTDNSPASAFTNAYFTRTLNDITLSGGTYTLVGPWVNIVDFEAPTSAPSTTTNGNWTATRGNNAFNDAMTYFHIDQSQRYMQSLGFTGSTGIQYRSIPVDTDGVNGEDNSNFQYPSNRLAFGHGCVDDNEDTYVILHEYGHAINYSINNNWDGGDTGAMGEGWGDYWAGSYRYSQPNGSTFHPAWAYPWDGHNACWPGRDMDSTQYQYDPNQSYDAHAQVNGVDGDELWGTPLFQSMVTLIGQGVSRTEVDKILLQSQFGLGSGLTMREMATAIVNTAKTLFPAGPHAGVFTTKFQAQKILESGTPPPTTAAKTLLMAWVSNNSQYESIVVVNNTGTTAAQLTLTGQRSSGSPVSVTRTVPAGGFLNERASSLFSALGSGSGYSVKVESSSENVYGLWVTNNLEAASGKSPSQGIAVEVPKSSQNLNERVGKKIMYGYLPIEDGLTSAPVVVNMGSSNTNVTLSFYSTSGSLINTQVLSGLEPFKPFATVVNNLVPAGTGDVYLIAESSSELISGVGFVFNNFSEPAIGNVSSIDSTSSKSMVYSWVSNNSQYESIVVVNNFGTSSASVTLKAQRSSGPEAQTTRTIPAKGFLKEKASSLFPSLGSGSGYTVKVESSSTSLRGRWVTNNLEAASGKSPSQGVAVDVPLSGAPASGNQRIGTKILLGYLPIEGGLTSAPVIVNVGTETTDVTLRFYNTAGSLIKTDSQSLQNLEPFRPFATVANNLVPVGSGDVYMTAESSGQLITGVGFVFNNFSEPAMGNASMLEVNQSSGGESALQNGVPVENISAAGGQLINYELVVPSDAYLVNFLALGANGDPDLIVKKGSASTSSYDYDWASENGVDDYGQPYRETVTLIQPGAGSYFPSLYGFGDTSFSGLTLIGSYYPSANTSQSTELISLLEGQSMVFPVDIPAGATSAIFLLSGPDSGDADLYVKLGSSPSSASDADDYSDTIGNTEAIVLPNPTHGTYYILVYAYMDFNGVTLTVSYQ